MNKYRNVIIVAICAVMLLSMFVSSAYRENPAEQLSSIFRKGNTAQLRWSAGE